MKMMKLDDELIYRASKLTGVSDKDALFLLGLKALISQESAKRLARLGGSEPKLTLIKRRSKN